MRQASTYHQMNENYNCEDCHMYIREIDGAYIKDVIYIASQLRLTLSIDGVALEDVVVEVVLPGKGTIIGPNWYRY